MLVMDEASLYAIYKMKDARFDGRFFVAISSTGIYCRPVCRARKAKTENCSYYKTAAEAEQAGYRPCLICRPELAPSRTLADTSSVLAHKAAKLIEENSANSLSISDISAMLGCSDRHLRRIFQQEFNVSPICYLQTYRLLLAKGLLTDTNLSVTDIAEAAGFGSLRRFNDLFKRRYATSPTALRKQLAGKELPDQAICLSLSYRPPYRFEDMLSFLKARAIPGVELVTDTEYMRTVSINCPDKRQLSGWVKLANNPDKNALTVTISESLLTALPQLIARLRHFFDLDSDPQTIYDALISMNDIRPDILVSGRRLPGSFDAFEMAVRAVLGQQITVKAARTLASRMVESFGTELQTDIAGLSHLFPSPADIAGLGDNIENKLGALGIIRSRSRTILELAKVFEEGRINFNSPSDIAEKIEKLMAIPGIGPWTANYIAMRSMGWTDAFLETDAGIKKALSPYSPKEMLKLAEAWRPWRSYATINLWNSL